MAAWLEVAPRECLALVRPLPPIPELGEPLSLSLTASLAETFQPTWPGGVGLGWGQRGLQGGIGEPSQPGAVPSELTASGNRSCPGAPRLLGWAVAQDRPFCLCRCELSMHTWSALNHVLCTLPPRPHVENLKSYLEVDRTGSERIRSLSSLIFKFLIWNTEGTLAG